MKCTVLALKLLKAFALILSSKTNIEKLEIYSNHTEEGLHYVIYLKLQLQRMTSVKVLLILVSCFGMNFFLASIHHWISHAAIIGFVVHFGANTTTLTVIAPSFHFLPHRKILIHCWNVELSKNNNDCSSLSMEETNLREIFTLFLLILTLI